MEQTQGHPDAVSHLRGACDRLLVENPDNAMLLLLRAFARLLTPRDSPREAISDLERAQGVLRQRADWTRAEELRLLARFITTVTHYDTRLQETVLPLVLRAHTSWLTQFNNHFLEGTPYG
jgi:ATP-dependent DNA helicase RecQ